MNEIKNKYFKQGKGLISGIDISDKVSDTHFIKCMFHPNTFDIHYKDCIFEDCDLAAFELSNAIDCIFK